MNLDQYTLEELEAFMQTEEFEQLDELSKKTLGSYVKKSKSDFALHSADFGRLLDKPGQGKEDARKMMRKRSRGIDKAVDRLTKESNDLEQYTLEELEAFMQTEEYEQLDELSKKTLGSYIKKATKDSNLMSRSGGFHAALANSAQDSYTKTQNLKHKEDSFKESDKRRKGIDKAVSRLTNESLCLLVQAIQEGNASDMSKLFEKLMIEKIAELVEQRKQEIAEDLFSEEQIDELSKKALGNYIKKSTAQVKSLSDMSGYRSSRSSEMAKSGDQKSSDVYASLADRDSKKATSRQNGINKATDRLIK